MAGATADRVTSPPAVGNSHYVHTFRGIGSRALRIVDALAAFPRMHVETVTNRRRLTSFSPLTADRNSRGRLHKDVNLRPMPYPGDDGHARIPATPFSLSHTEFT